MIEEQAQVTQLRGDMAEVVTLRRSACGGCEARAGCGTSLLAAWLPQRRLTFELPNLIGAEAGDTVIVGLDERLLQRGSLLLYALPLGGLLSGALLGELLFLHLGLPSELGAVLTGLLGLTAALLMVRRLTSSGMRHGGNGVRLLRVARRSISVAPEDLRLATAQQQQGLRRCE